MPVALNITAILVGITPRRKDDQHTYQNYSKSSNKVASQLFMMEGAENIERCIFPCEASYPAKMEKERE